MGAAFLVGGARRFGRTFVEATAGLGLEAYQLTSTVTTESISPDGVNTVNNQTFSSVTLGLYLRAQATGGVALSKSFDLLASVGGHLGTVGRQDAFFSTSLGLRFRFQ